MNAFRIALFATTGIIASTFLAPGTAHAADISVSNERTTVVTMGASDTLTVRPSGSITSNPVTVDVTGVAATSITNHGDIDAQGGAGTGAGIHVDGGSLTGSLVNTGTIGATGNAGNNNVYAIYVEGGAIDGGIVNRGIISSTGAIAINLDLDDETALTLDGGRIIGDVVDQDSSLGFSTVTVAKNFKTEGDFDVSDLTVDADKTLTISAGDTVTLDDMSTSADGIFSFGATSAANAGQLIVTNGNLDLTDAVIRAATKGGMFEVGDEFLIADGLGAIVGGPGDELQAIKDSSFYYDFAVADGTAAATPTDDSELFMFVTNTVDLAEATTTESNRGAAGVILEDLDGSGDAVIGEIQQKLTSAGSKEEFNRILEATTPTLDTGNTAASVGMASTMLDLAGGQIAMATTGTESDERGVASGNYADGLHFWVQGFGSRADQGESGGIQGYDANIVGVAVGADTRNMNDDTTYGVSFGYGVADVDSKNANTTNTDVTSYQAMIYANHDLGDNFFANGMVVGGFNKNDQTRHNVGGIEGLEADSDYDSWTAGGRVGLGKNLYAGYDGSIKMAPQVFADYLHFDSDGYTETGAGGANLTTDGTEQDFLNLGASLQIEKSFRIGNSLIAKPDVHATYRYDVIDDTADTTASLAAGGSTFDAKGPDEDDPSSYTVGTGLKFYGVAGWDLTANYDYTFKSSYNAHSGFARAAYEF